MFTRCLELRSGWPDATFARAQSLRKQKKWGAARNDFLQLVDEDKGWSHAFAGYCSMRDSDFVGAASNYLVSYNTGLRDIDFLLNFALTQKERQLQSSSAKLFGDVLTLQADNKEAIYNRAMANLMIAKNSPTQIPSPEAFRDGLRYRELEPTFDGAFVAAWIFAEAARKDKTYQDEAISYLAEAVRLGLPKESLAVMQSELRRLIPFIDPVVLQAARSVPDPQKRKRERTPIHELPDTPSLEAFQSKYGAKRSLKARSESP
jgi:hypothetical protein